MEEGKGNLKVINSPQSRGSGEGRTWRSGWRGACRCRAPSSLSTRCCPPGGSRRRPAAPTHPT
eukprot:808878-Rhodomonas_salina.2